MGHGTVGNLLNPKKAVGFALDPAGTAIRTARGVPTTPRTMLDPGNAVWPQAAPGVPYATGNSAPTGPQIPAGAPLIDPKTNMRAGGASGTPMVTSIGGLGGKNQLPMPNPQAPQTQPLAPNNGWMTIPQNPTGPRAM